MNWFAGCSCCFAFRCAFYIKTIRLMNRALSVGVVWCHLETLFLNEWMNECESDPCKNSFRIEIAHDSNVHIIEKNVCNQLNFIVQQNQKKIMQIHVWVNNKNCHANKFANKYLFMKQTLKKWSNAKKEVDFLFACIRHVCGKQYPANIPTIKWIEMGSNSYPLCIWFSFK